MYGEFEQTQAKSYLGQWVRIIIDRPLGSKHPKQDVIYTLNYGYVPNTVAGDGKEQDAYVIGVEQPVKEFYGFCAAVIERHNDVEDKLVLVPSEVFSKMLSDKTILEATDFVEKYFDVTLHRFTAFK